MAMSGEQDDGEYPEDGRFVLLVDDDPDVRESFQLALEMSGYPIMTMTAAEGLTALRRGLRPGVILLDLMMPGVGGAEFIAAQREDAALARLPVIMVSAARDVGAVAEGLGLTWVKKPIELEQLIELIRPFCAPERGPGTS